MENDITLSNQFDESRVKQLKYRKWALVPVLFCFVFGGAITLYVVPEYLQKTIKERYQGNKTGSDVTNDTCLEDGTSKDINDKVQQETAKWNLYTSLAAYLPAIFANLILGAYSDFIGRKFLLIVSLSGVGIKIGVVAIIIKLKLDFVYFIFANLIEGFAGSFTLIIAVSFSYISDLTTVGNQRTLFIVLLELLYALSITLSSLTCGYFIKETGFFYPALTGTALVFLGVFIAIVALPETLARTNRHNQNTDKNTTNSGKAHSGKCSVLSQTLGNIRELYFGQNRPIRTAKYIILLLAFMFEVIPYFGNADTLYQLGAPFCWNPTKIGWYGAIKTFLSATIGLFSAYIFKKCLQNETIAVIGLLSFTSGLVVTAFARTSSELYLVPLFGILGSLTTPMIRSVLSQMTSSHLQGALFASIGAVETTCVLLGAVSANAIYAATLKIMNGFVFLVSAMYAFVALVLLITFMILKRCSSDDHILLHEVLIEEIEENHDSLHPDLNGPN